MNNSPSPAPDLDPGRALELLHGLRERLAETTSIAYAEHLGAARQDLRRLSERAGDPELRDLYASGHDFLSNGGLSLIASFRESFTADCDAAIRVLTGQASDTWEAASELSLVDADTFERDLAVGKLAAKATYACSQQLTALDRRVAALLGLTHLDPESNPLSPRRLFGSFLRAAGSSWAGERLSLVLLETFEHYTAGSLPTLYQELNEYLVENGVLKTLPICTEDPVREDDRRSARGGGNGGSGSGISDVFVQLAGGLGQSRLGAGLAGGLGALPAATAAALAAAGASSGDGGDQTPQFAPLVLGQFIDGLTGLQRGTAQAAATLGIDQGDFDPSSSALLHSLGGSPLLRWLRPNDAMTVDLIAMLFDCIFSDPEVSTGLRGEIGRLQVPILKVALLNKGFFSDQRHPARRLMDVIGSATRGWSPRNEGVLLKSVRSAVDSINAGFENDTGVFAAQVERLEGILHGADQRARENVSALVRRLEQRDRKVVADATVSDQIVRRTRDEALPADMNRFIGEVWRALLRQVYIEEGEQGKTWQQALLTLDELVWSLRPKTSPRERRRLMEMLPGLLDRLRTGMLRIGRGDDWDGFLQRLMALHMGAIKPSSAATEAAADGGLAGTGAGRAPGLIEPDAALAAGLATATRGDRPAGDDAVLSLNPEADAAPADAEAAAAQRLAVGDWVAFSSDDKPEVSLRACWISRYGGLCLFADRPGEHARVLTRTQLARELRAGGARMLSSEPLTDRAVARLLVKAAPNPPASAAA